LIKQILAITLTLFLGALILNSCSGNSAQQPTSGIEYTSAYICPMHCEGSGSENEGKCPECGMDYIENKAAKDSTSSYIPSKTSGTMCWKPKH